MVCTSIYFSLFLLLFCSFQFQQLSPVYVLLELAGFLCHCCSRRRRAPLSYCQVGVEVQVSQWASVDQLSVERFLFNFFFCGGGRILAPYYASLQNALTESNEFVITVAHLSPLIPWRWGLIAPWIQMSVPAPHLAFSDTILNSTGYRRQGLLVIDQRG